MARNILHEIDTPKGMVRIYTEPREGQPNPMWFATLSMENGVIFTMIRRNSEITTAEALKMISA